MGSERTYYTVLRCGPALIIYLAVAISACASLRATTSASTEPHLLYYVSLPNIQAKYQQLTALNPQTGATEWQVNIPGDGVALAETHGVISLSSFVVDAQNNFSSVLQWYSASTGRLLHSQLFTGMELLDLQMVGGLLLGIRNPFVDTNDSESNTLIAWQPTTGAVVWQQALSSGQTPASFTVARQALVSNGTIVVAATETEQLVSTSPTNATGTIHLNAFRLADGLPLWNNGVAGSLTNMAAAGQTLALGSALPTLDSTDHQESIDTLDITSGNMLWQHALGGPGTLGLVTNQAVTAIQDPAWAAVDTGTGSVVAFGDETGAQTWRMPLQGASISANPDMYDDGTTIYGVAMPTPYATATTAALSAIFALQASAGNVQWTYPLEFTPKYATIVGSQGQLFVAYTGASNGKLIALNASDHTLLWQIPITDPALPLVVIG